MPNYDGSSFGSGLTTDVASYAPSDALNTTDWFGGFKNTVSDATSWIGSTAKEVIGGLSLWEDYQMSNDINKIRKEAILGEIRDAPRALQATIPSQSQIIDGGKGAMDQLRNIVLGSNAAASGSSMLMYGALAIGAYMVLKK